MPRPKIDRVKLSRMLRAGKAQREIAQFFGVTEGAITKAKKEININVVKNVALENAHRIVDKELNAVDQLHKINQDAHELLDLCMAWVRGDDTALHALETHTGQVAGESPGASANHFRLKDPREVALQAMKRIESQLELQLKIFTALYDMKQVQAFQEEVLAAIGAVSPEVRNAIVRKLSEKSALRQSLGVDR